LAGRVPLLGREKALIMQTTTWDEESYDAGIKRVEHEYFHAVHGTDDAKRLVRGANSEAIGLMPLVLQGLPKSGSEHAALFAGSSCHVTARGATAGALRPVA
jgi:hypothetical protein